MYLYTSTKPHHLEGKQIIPHFLYRFLFLKRCQKSIGRVFLLLLALNFQSEVCVNIVKYTLLYLFPRVIVCSV